MGQQHQQRVAAILALAIVAGLVISVSTLASSWSGAASQPAAARPSTGSAAGEQGDLPLNLRVAQTDHDSVSAGATKVTVTGHHDITVAPDTAQIRVRVETRDEAAGVALERNSRDVAQVIKAVEAAGIPADDVTTAGFAITPLTADRDVPMRDTAVPIDILGFHVVNEVAVTTTDLEGLGQLIDVAVAAGANGVSGLSFSVGNPAAFRAQALRGAVSAALADAHSIAEALGGQITAVVAVETLDAGVSTAFAVMEDMAFRSSPPIRAGDVSVSASVQLTVEVQGASADAAPPTPPAPIATPLVDIAPTVAPTEPQPTEPQPTAGTPAATATGAVSLLTATSEPAYPPPSAAQATATLALPVRQPAISPTVDRAVPTATAAAGTDAVAPGAPATMQPAADDAFHPLVQSSVSRFRGTEPAVIVATSEESWRQDLRRLLPADLDVTTDWDNELLVAAFLGRGTTQGALITVEDIVFDDGTLVVRASASGAVDNGQASPFHLVRVRRSADTASLTDDVVGRLELLAGR